MAQRDRFGGRFGTIVAAARRGEPQAFEEIYLRLSPIVAGYLRLQGCRDADDLTSEVFIGVLRNVEAFKGDEAAFRTWVFTIAQRRLLDARRRAARKPPPGPLPADLDAGPAGDEDVEAAVARSLEADHIRALCARLPPDQRNVVLLRLLGRFTVGDVAEVLGKTTGGVKAAQRRGFRTIARLMAREDGGYGVEGADRAAGVWR